MYHIFRQNNLYFEVSVMRQADALTKEYLSNNEIFADVFNYLIYDGQQRILPDNLIERDTSEITLPLGKRGELATIQKFRDILKGCVTKEYKNTLYVLFGIENQSHIHYAMPVRNMLYDAINYSAQINEKKSNIEKYESKTLVLKKLQRNFYQDGIQRIALFQLLLLPYILVMTNGIRQKAFRRCFLRQMNPLRNFFQITNFI